MTTTQSHNSGIASATINEALIEVCWQDSVTTSFHSIWLRDNCRCEQCGDPSIGRRKLKLTNIELDIMATAIKTSETSLHITWHDGHQTEFTSEWLRNHAYDDNARRNRAFKPRLWDDNFRASPPRQEYDEIMSGDERLLQALHRVRDQGLCLIRHAPVESGALEALALKIGYPQESNFGRVQDLVVDRGQSSIAYDVQALKAHTDEPYRASPPGLLLFHCIETDSSGGGSSIFLDGFEIAEQLRQHDSRGFTALCRNAQAYRRHFADDVDLIAEFPILSVDDFGHLTGIRLNDRVAAPLSIPPVEVDPYYRGLKFLLALAENENYWIKLTLQPGDIAIFDNHRILHGRTDLTMTGKRWLQWIQIERGDFYSSLRIIADRLKLDRDATPLLKGAYS